MSSGHRSFRAKWRGTVFSTDTPEPAIHFTTPMTIPFVAAMTLLSATLSFAHACGEVVTIPTPRQYHHRLRVRISAGPPSLAACEGRAPHGFTDQVIEVAARLPRGLRGLSWAGNIRPTNDQTAPQVSHLRNCNHCLRLGIGCAGGKQSLLRFRRQRPC